MPLDPMRQIIRGNDALVSCTLATRRISGEGKDQVGAGGLAFCQTRERARRDSVIIHNVSPLEIIRRFSCNSSC